MLELPEAGSEEDEEEPVDCDWLTLPPLTFVVEADWPDVSEDA